MPGERRIPKLTPGFHRARKGLGIEAGSVRGLAVAATVRALANADALPESADFETAFNPG